MSKVNYRYNPSSLAYEKVERTLGGRVKKALSFLATGLVFAVVIVLIAWTVFDSPKEKMLKRENAFLQSQIQNLNKDFKLIEEELAFLQEKDDNIYREIHGADPIPANERRAGVGGANRYRDLEGFDASGLVVKTRKRLDKIAKQMVVQSDSYDKVMKMAKDLEVQLAHQPAIIPILSKDNKRMASGFGYRIDPIYKVRKFHQGMDFTAKRGTEIVATGDGVVKLAEHSKRGYGKHVVISHGYGYETLYAHMSKIKVRPGQKVKRNQVIGLVGNTGKSTAPHIHYEVHKNGEAINPVNFFYNDLNDEQEEEMRRRAAQENQSFD